MKKLIISKDSGTMADFLKGSSEAFGYLCDKGFNPYFNGNLRLTIEHIEEDQATFEEKARQRFDSLIHGSGPTVSRHAVADALRDIFKKD